MGGLSPVTAILTAILAVAGGAAADDADARARRILARMTRAERITLLHGTGKVEPYVGNTAAIERVGVPALTLNDGPQGFRVDKYPGTSTQWPSALTVAATWDAASVEAWGRAMGQEFRAKGANVFLGPGLNVARVPHGGRNFEYLSGEDPYLGAALVGPLVRGVQSQRVVACAKHWVLNNQESDRLTISSVADGRTLRELYVPPFAAAVRAGVGSFMCAYNRVNGTYACSSRAMLRGLLKTELGFGGWVMSDWEACHARGLGAGLDQEMPEARCLNETSLARADERLLNASALAILTSLVRVGVLGDEHVAPRPVAAGGGARDGSDASRPPPPPPPPPIAANVTSAAHRDLARALAARATVLLKNARGLLPLRAPQTPERTRVLVVGREAVAPSTGGRGSGAVVPASVRAPLDELRARLPASGGSGSGAGYVVEYVDGRDTLLAEALALGADVVLAFAGTTSGEGSDRRSLALGDGQDEWLCALSVLAGHKMAVVLTSPGAVLTAPWAGRSSAVLASFLPGEAFGAAIADVLVGDAEPSGRLPLSFPRGENDLNWTRAQFPGEHGVALYSEGLAVGYRGYEVHGVRPAFPFGHGLSFAGRFEYSQLRVDAGARTVSARVANAGVRPGTEVAQLYVRLPPPADAPFKQLRGFARLELAAGEAVRADFKLSRRDLSVWRPARRGEGGEGDQARGGWHEVCGAVEIRVGASVEDIRLSGEMHLPCPQ